MLIKRLPYAGKRKEPFGKRKEQFRNHCLQIEKRRTISCRNVAFPTASPPMPMPTPPHAIALPSLLVAVFNPHAGIEHIERGDGKVSCNGRSEISIRNGSQEDRARAKHFPSNLTVDRLSSRFSLPPYDNW
ncbi:Hypothetical predicted protein [Olea europaea subsp. europaea]|uniref:Uncharacterized protein n=1 Tax=Olea europaea subsp. europaea TaxID=158383 RepID=A0A8S0U495_OLEEU|nr:Hypothetical predicted protein [Olea europaea subsp. europaea]